MRNRKPSIYLAGGCKHEADGGREWRSFVQKNYDEDFNIINPLDYFDYGQNWHQSDRQVKEYFMSRIKKSDVVLVNLNNSNLSCGTCQEVQYAVDHEIPVIGFGTENVYAWLGNVDCQAVFDDVGDAMDYLIEYYGG